MVTDSIFRIQTVAWKCIEVRIKMELQRSEKSLVVFARVRDCDSSEQGNSRRQT